MTSVSRSKTLADLFTSYRQQGSGLIDEMDFSGKSERSKMSILRALQKQRTEDDPAGEARPAQNIVPFERKARLANRAPELLSSRNFSFGNSSSAFNGQPDSLVGTALPDLETDFTAGANLNAGGLT